MDGQPLNRTIPKIKDLDIYQHLKHNILNSENNCKDFIASPVKKVLVQSVMILMSIQIIYLYQKKNF